jgi:hypothetical protein
VTRRAPEQALQRAVMELLKISLGGVVWYTHFPAGGGGAMRGKILKGMGLKPGVPDIEIIDGGRAYWLELKAKRGRLTAAQHECHTEIRRAGALVAVIKSIDEVLPVLRHWGVALKPGVHLEPP